MLIKLSYKQFNAKSLIKIHVKLDLDWTVVFLIDSLQKDPAQMNDSLEKRTEVRFSLVQERLQRVYDMKMVLDK